MHPHIEGDRRTARGGPQPAILAAAPRCGARTRGGSPCRSPAIHGRARCRMHGGKGSGAPRGNRNAWKHGLKSARIRDIARYLRATSPAATARLLASYLPSPWRKPGSRFSSSSSLPEGSGTPDQVRG